MQQTTIEKTEMSLRAQTTECAAYNLWANKTLVNWLKTKPADLLQQPIPSSFPGVMGTLIHIWDVERAWLSQLNRAPIKSFRMEGFHGTLEDVFEGIVKQSETLLAYVSSLSDDDLAGDCFFSNKWVGDQTLPRVKIIEHALNHSTYHRGQVTTIGRNLGFTDAPMTDYMFYVLSLK